MDKNEWIKKRVTCPIRTGTRKPEEGLVKEWRKRTRGKRECAEGKSQERGKECEKWKMPREKPVWVRGKGIITAGRFSNFQIAKSGQSEFGAHGTGPGFYWLSGVHRESRMGRWGYRV